MLKNKFLSKFSIKNFSNIFINRFKKYRKNNLLLSFQNYSKSFTSNIINDNSINDLDKLYDDDETDVDKRIKNLSLKLLSMNKSGDVIILFEEKYLKGIFNNFSVEEFVIIIYFYTTLLERENLEMGSSVRVVDKRIDKCLSMLEESLEDIDITNLLALTWSFSILVNKYNHNLKKELLIKVLSLLPDQLPVEKKGEIPTLCFSISTLINESDNDLIKLVLDKISKYTYFFLSNKGMNYTSILNLSLLAVSWSRVNYTDKEELDRSVQYLKDLIRDSNEESADQICKILWSFTIINYKNDILAEAVHEYLELNIEKIDINNIIDIFVTFTNSYIESTNTTEILINAIISKEKSKDINLDISTYINIWLSLSKFYLKTKNEEGINKLQSIINFLFSNYQKRVYLHARNFNISELCSMLISFSILNIEYSTIHKDILIIIIKNIDEMNIHYLIQLLSIAKYISNFKKHSDFYTTIHDKIIKYKNNLDNNQLRLISRIIKNDGMITNSPFLN